MWVGVFPLVYVNCRTGVHQPKISLAQTLTSAFTLLAIVVGSAILDNQFSFAWKLAYSISAVTQCFVTFACYTSHGQKLLLRDRASRATNGVYVRPKAIVHTVYGILVFGSPTEKIT